MSPGTVHRAGRAALPASTISSGRRRRARRPRACCSSSWRCGGEAAARAWQLFHVNWLYFTGLAGGSVAFAAVQKITNAKWSGLVIRFAEASVAFLPVSLLGLRADVHAGVSRHLRPHGGAAARRCTHAQGGVALARVHVRPGCSSGCGALLARVEADPRRPHARHVRHPRRRGPPGAARCSSAGPGTTTARARRHRARRRIPARVGRSTWSLYAIVFTMVAFDGIMALQPHWFSNLLGGWYFMGSFLGAHMLLALHDPSTAPSSSASAIWSRPSSGTTSASSASASRCSGPTSCGPSSW